MSCHRPADPDRSASPASRPFHDNKDNGSFSSPGAACCTFPTHAPGEHRDRRVAFLKAVSTGASKHLSQVEGMPGKEDFAPRGYITRCCGD